MMANPDRSTVAFCLRSADEHQLPGHPEGPHRLQLLRDLADHFPSGQMSAVDCAPAPLELLQRVHASSYLDQLAGVTFDSDLVLLDGGDTYMTRASWRDAQLAAGAAVAVTKAVLSGAASVGFSLARPPGHHATSNQPMGFCLVNNIAAAAAYAQAEGCDRVGIFDFDVHHGNGTQAIFEQSASVAYASFHQRGIFPGTGGLQESGSGDGQGFTLNLPLPPGTGEAAYLQAFEQLLRPFMHRFQPQLLLVSAGYDAHWRDPLAQLRLAEHSYYQLGQQLQALAQSCCGGKLVFILEGGYDPRALSRSVRETVAGVLGHPASYTEPAPARGPEPDVASLLKQARAVHGLS